MNVFITGNPGSGKSTLISRLLEEMSGRKVSGILTPEVRVGGTRQGFKIIDWASKEEEILASVTSEGGPRVSRYRVNLRGIDIILDKFLDSYEGSEYVVIDEIGKMELRSKKFREVLGKILRSNKTVIATVSKKLANDYQTQGALYELRKDNFEDVYVRISALFKGSAEGERR